MTITKILVPIDFSTSTSRVLDCARTLADALGASLHLLHVIGDPLATPLAAHREQANGSRRLQALLDDSDRSRRHAVVQCEMGTPALEIARVAADESVDLIVMGTHAHGPAFRMATGSIAETVIGMAPCAVLAVKAAEEKIVAAA